MSHGTQESVSARPPRVKLAGSVLVMLRLENGRHIRGKLHQVSVTGGLLHMEHPLDEGIKVEVMFHVGSHTVRSKGAMLFPMWATKGCLQPFRFIDFDEEGREQLAATLQTLLDLGAATTSFP
ncbi:MAG TPA: hypothetical protein VJQ82_25255 [Terriglobales bacterium]|nr:hypothetical protein [Terriglobales bacterium]